MHMIGGNLPIGCVDSTKYAGRKKLVLSGLIPDGHFDLAELFRTVRFSKYSPCKKPQPEDNSQRSKNGDDSIWPLLPRHGRNRQAEDRKYCTYDKRPF